ncbi:MAG: SpoIIE family protein phosphatase [Salinivirgaceae bacterium]|nr:SpoIIE family protein phosphatase [Salinivirgaceae bacterium]
MRTGKRHIILIIMALLGWLPNLNGQSSTTVDNLMLMANAMSDSKQKLTVLQSICLRHNSVDTVLRYAEQMQVLAQRLDDHRANARAHQFMGWCYGNRGNYEKALFNHYRALIIYDSIADTLGMARCYNATGEDFLDLKDYYSADEYFHKALDIYTAMGRETETPSIYRNLGSMYKDYKIFETAKQYFRNAIEIDSSNNSLTGLAIDYNYMAETEYDEYRENNHRANIINAKRYCDMAYAKAVELKDSAYLFYAIKNSLPICLDYASFLDSTARQQLLDSCVHIYHVAMTYVKENGYYSSYYMLENCRAKHLLLNHRYTDCLNHLESIRKPNDLIEEEPTIDYDCYIDCYIAMGDYQKALEYKKLKETSESQEYFMETALNSSKSSTKEEYEKMLRQQLKDRKNRELIFNEHKKRLRITNISAGIITILLIVFAVFIFQENRNKQRNNKLLLKQKDDYETQRNILANINHQITDSIRYAKEIQNSVIPSPAIMNAIFGESLVIWMPLDIVSGNFYWASLHGRYKMLAVADCMRHGVPGAFTSMLGITSLNDIASSEVTDDYCPTAAIMLDKLRVKIENTIPRHDQSEPANMIDIALCIIDTESNTMQFAGAHSPMFIVRNGKLTVIPSDDVHIGDGSDSQTEFTNTKIAVHEGDVVYLYTDGIAQQLNTEWEYSTGILTELLTLIYDKPFSEQTEYINYALSKSPKSHEIVNQTDDILLVGIRI